MVGDTDVEEVLEEYSGGGGVWRVLSNATHIRWTGQEGRSSHSAATQEGKNTEQEREKGGNRKNREGANEAGN